MHGRSLEATMHDAIPWNQTLDLAGKTAFGETLKALEWLGLWSANGSMKELISGAPVPTAAHTPLELFAMLLAPKLHYAPGERDMLVLSHEVIVHDPKNPNVTQQEEVHRSSLVAHGDDSASAVARTVGLPAAHAALDVLDGKVGIRGVSGPGEGEVYEAVPGRLEECGLGMIESVEVVKAAPGAGTTEDSLRTSSI